jgi:hypothetical protein
MISPPGDRAVMADVHNKPMVKSSFKALVLGAPIAYNRGNYNSDG